MMNLNKGVGKHDEHSRHLETKSCVLQVKFWYIFILSIHPCFECTTFKVTWIKEEKISNAVNQ